MKPTCWTVIDRAVVADLRKAGWRVRRVSVVAETVDMRWQAARAPWLITAPDTARLWDIARGLESERTDGKNGFAGRLKRYLARGSVVHPQ